MILLFLHLMNTGKETWDFINDIVHSDTIGEVYIKLTMEHARLQLMKNNNRI